MYAGMPVSRSSVSSPGPSTTNQPRPEQRDDRRDRGQRRPAPARRRGVPVAAGPGGQPVGADERGDHEAPPAARPRGSRGPAGSSTAGRSSETAPSTAAATAATSATIQQTSTGIRVARGISASTASTASSDAEPPRRAEVAEPAGQQVERSRATGSGSRPASSSRPAPAPCSSAGSHHGASSTGTTPSATAGGPQTERSRIDAGDDREARRRPRRRPSSGGEEPGDRRERRDQREQQPGAPGGAPAAVGLGVGEAERGVGQPRQQRRDDDDAEPAVAPGAADDRDQRVGRRAPRRAASAARRPASTRRPTTRRNRQAPQSATGTASSSSAETAAAGAAAEERWPSSASGSTYAGAGTAVPVPERVPRLEVQPPPVAGVGRAPARARRRTTGPNASRAPTSDQQHEQGQRRRRPGW